MSRRLADLLAPLAESGAPAAQPIAEAHGFLMDQQRRAAAVTPEAAHDLIGDQPSAHPLDRLIHGFGLSAHEVDLVILAGLCEHHEGFAAVFENLHPQRQPYSTVALAAQLLERREHLAGAPGSSDDARAALHDLLHTGPAVTRGVLEIRGDGPFFSRHLRLAGELWPVLLGIDTWPATLRPVRRPAVMAGLDAWLAMPETAQAIGALTRIEPVTVLVTAEDDELALDRCLALAGAAGVSAVPLIARDPLDTRAEAWLQVHATARGAVPVLPISDTAAAVLADLPGPLMLYGRAGSARVAGARPLVALACERLPLDAQRVMWAHLLPALSDHAAQLAARHPLEPREAADVVTDLRWQERTDGACSLDHVAAAARARAGAGHLSGVSLRRPHATWDHLVLPPTQLEMLRDAAQRVHHQHRVLDEWRFLRDRAGARGVRLLLCGPPGTGKTLSAEVLAHALGTDLLVVDVTRVVSKWIGETEKNLAQAFDAAERARAVLLFDEADALFGKRTEVSDAHDRYANLETAYLLMRLERFEGLAILSTNLRSNIDPAFLRRIEMVVEYEQPDADERLALWRAHVPDEAPLAGDVSLDDLAGTYPIVGGLIRNAAVAAAFLAAAEGSSITHAHFIRAIEREYEKAGKPFPGDPRGRGQHAAPMARRRA